MIARVRSSKRQARGPEDSKEDHETSHELHDAERIPRKPRQTVSSMRGTQTDKEARRIDASYPITLRSPLGEDPLNVSTKPLSHRTRIYRPCVRRLSAVLSQHDLPDLSQPYSHPRRNSQEHLRNVADHGQYRSQEGALHGSRARRKSACFRRHPSLPVCLTDRHDLICVFLAGTDSLRLPSPSETALQAE